MEPLQTTTTLIHHRDALAFSALPNAPVQGQQERHPLAEGTRLHLARVLHRLAAAVAPKTRPRGAWASSR